jgi:hypothetical protein
VKFREYDPGAIGANTYFSVEFLLGIVPANISPEVNRVPLGKRRCTINSVALVVFVVVAVFPVITCGLGLPLSGDETDATKAVAPIIIERTKALATMEASRCIRIYRFRVSILKFF